MLDRISLTKAYTEYGDTTFSEYCAITFSLFYTTLMKFGDSNITSGLFVISDIRLIVALFDVFLFCNLTKAILFVEKIFFLVCQNCLLMKKTFFPVHSRFLYFSTKSFLDC